MIYKLQRTQLKSLLSTFGIYFSLIDALSIDNVNLIIQTINFILQSDLQI